MQQTPNTKQTKKQHQKHHKTKSIKQQLQKAAIQAKGAYKTEADRKHIMGRFADHLKANNIQIKSIDHVKEKYIHSYVNDRLEAGISKRTLQNEMAAIRVTLREAGRNKLANSPRISNKALQIDNASRKGTKTAITNEHYQEIYQKALKTVPQIAALLELSRSLGLRGEEAVQCCQTLKTWQTALKNGTTKLNIIFGTKGGRPRQTMVLDRTRVINAVNTALGFVDKQNGKVIDKPNLKEAMTYWRNQTYRIGLKGEISPHSLRYAFTKDVVTHYQSQGYSRKEALALASMDLGHGDGRGTYVESTYLQEKTVDGLAGME